MKSHFVFVIAIILILQAASPAPAAIIDSINADLEPIIGWWNVLAVKEFGWVYTPSFSYTLTGVQTKFGPSVPDPPPPFLPPVSVRVEVYDGIPDLGGGLLRQATFDYTDSIGLFYGSSFSPLELTAGQDYFIGFRSDGYLPLNSADSGTSLPCYTGPYNDGSYPNPTTYNICIHPVLRFEGVPEPATLLLLGLGGLVLRRRG